MWKLSNVTRWVNPEACYFERREGIHSAATSSLRSGGIDPLKAGGSQEFAPRSATRGPVGLHSMRVQPILKPRSTLLGPTSPSTCSSATKAFEAA
jgi:hypothetical protein